MNYRYKLERDDGDWVEMDIMYFDSTVDVVSNFIQSQRILQRLQNKIDELQESKSKIKTQLEIVKSKLPKLTKAELEEIKNENESIYNYLIQEFDNLEEIEEE